MTRGVVLDAGALIAVERGVRQAWAELRETLPASARPVTHAGVVAQVWRGPEQARMARALRGVDVRPLDIDLARSVGRLLRRSRTSDVIGAAVVLLARDGDTIVTSDPDDIGALASWADLEVEVLPV